MTGLTPSRQDDETFLKILHRIDVLGMKYREAGAPFGKSRSAVSGMMHHLRQQQVMACECEKPENKDGGMPTRWWR